jgi:hemerythrin-like domain-containing protein
MRSTEDLEHEHRAIELVLTGLERMAKQLEAGRALNRDRGEKALELVRNFADKCHYGKEEQHYFTMLEARGLPRATGLVSELLHEHGEGRRHARAMARSLVGATENDPEDGPLFARHARDYVSLLRAHIHKEDKVLFPIADAKLTPEDDAALIEAFARIERKAVGEGTQGKYARWAHELAERAD